MRLRDHHTRHHCFLMHVSATTARVANLPSVAFLPVPVLTRDAQRRSTRQRDAQNNQVPGALLASAEAATLFSSASTLLNQLRTRVSHTNVARSHLVDRVKSVRASQRASSPRSVVRRVLPSLHIALGIGVESPLHPLLCLAEASCLGYLFQKSAPILTPCSLSSTIR
jgi:hypothetical protein